DTVSTQREGTSLALIDEGYGEKTCIISGGLGTMTVSHKGQTYYVCCTGCKAAFEDDPERWIARAEEQKKN
ncbi:MAG: YHS domain-containing protein, partial [Planctomycetaceae bacterium]